MATKRTVEVTETAEGVQTEEKVPVVNTGEPVNETSYTKEQILKSKRFANSVDVLNTILGDRRYTITEVDGLLKDFLNKEVE